VFDLLSARKKGGKKSKISRADGRCTPALRHERPCGAGDKGRGKKEKKKNASMTPCGFGEPIISLRAPVDAEGKRKKRKKTESDPPRRCWRPKVLMHSSYGKSSKQREKKKKKK